LLNGQGRVDFLIVHPYCAISLINEHYTVCLFFGERHGGIRSDKQEFLDEGNLDKISVKDLRGSFDLSMVDIGTVLTVQVLYKNPLWGLQDPGMFSRHLAVIDHQFAFSVSPNDYLIIQQPLFAVQFPVLGNQEGGVLFFHLSIYNNTFKPQSIILFRKKMAISRKPGEVLQNRYLIKKIIGRGGMGSVYLADDTLLEGRQCALKEVEYDRSLDSVLIKEAQEQFLREATILARLDHPNLPKVSDFFTIESCDYLVMDYVPGEDLRTIILQAKQNNSFLPLSDIRNWADQLGDALSFLHSQEPPIVHRDIKPSNLKITPSGILKLVDFGLVKILVPDDVTITVIQGQGTAIYTPLEQYGGDGIHTDVRSDIYSFGATLYHLATNTQPADARERFLQPGRLMPPGEINPAISSQMEKAILWALQLHPDDRPQTVKQFTDALLGNTKKLVEKINPHIDHRRLSSNKNVKYLFWISVGLLFLSFLISFFA